jgi:hypothetical protein
MIPTSIAVADSTRFLPARKQMEIIFSSQVR